MIMSVGRVEVHACPWGSGTPTGGGSIPSPWALDQGPYFMARKEHSGCASTVATGLTLEQWAWQNAGAASPCDTLCPEPTANQWCCDPKN